MFCKQTSGKEYVKNQDDEEKRQRHLREYRECSKRAGKKEVNSLNTLVKMGADRSILTADLAKVGYSAFTQDNFRNINMRERMVGIEAREIISQNPIKLDERLSLEEQEEELEKFTKKLHDKKGKTA